MAKKWRQPPKVVYNNFGAEILWIFVLKLAEPQPRTYGTLHKSTAPFTVQEVIDTLDDFENNNCYF